MDKAAEADTAHGSASTTDSSAMSLLEIIEGLGETERTIDLDHAQEAVELMYRPAEPIFGALAADMVDLGWSVFPQESDGARRPGFVQGEMINWSSTYHLADQRPSKDLVTLWSQHCATLNVAMVLGPASGDVFALDIDVMDEALALRALELADDILGYTPFRRVGRAPKIALLFRNSPDDPAVNLARKFVARDDEGTTVRGTDGIDVLTKGKLITAFGKHHQTGRYFQWLDLSPAVYGPEHAPIAEGWKIKTWMEALDSVRRFHRGAGLDGKSGDGQEWAWEKQGDLVIPKVRRQQGKAAAWVENDEGLVVDGRETFLSEIVFRLVRMNPAAVDKGEEGLSAIAAAVLEQFSTQALTTGRWATANLKREIVPRVRHVARKMKQGEIAPWTPRSQARVPATSPTAQPAPPPREYPPARVPVEDGPDSLDFLPETGSEDKPGTRRPLRCAVHPANEAERKQRAIEKDRSTSTQAVQEALQASFDAFFNEVYGGDRLPGDGPTRVHILKAPTGAGKTSQAIRYIAADPRTKLPHHYYDAKGMLQEGRCPILFLLPTYANIDELRARSEVLNLDGSLPDAELRRQAEERGLIAEDDLDTRLAELRRDALDAGLTTMVYRGKLAAGCKMAEIVRMAMDAGIATEAFCKAKNPDGEEVTCAHYVGCPAIAQRAEIARSHVVFMPHAFMSLNVPEALKHARAVIADERIHHLFLHTTTFSATTLMIPRRKPRLSRREMDKGVTPEDLMQERLRATEVALRALRDGVCPARALRDYSETDPTTGAVRYPGGDYVQSALRVCGSAIQRDGALRPNMDADEVRELCSTPTGVEVREERRFWKIIEERMALLTLDSLAEDRIAHLDARLSRPGDEAQRASVEADLRRLEEEFPRAKGERDARIQFILETSASGESRERIRISWRQTPNWSDVPTLLLDASAAPEVIRKIWNGNEVVEHDIPAPMNVRIVGVVDRTYSNASLIASPSASPMERALAAKLMNKVRQAITTISALYGWGRVVAGTAIPVRRAINASWAGPENVDWCHFGAMRGLDFAKHHAAAISIGRMEVPIRSIDGLVAALTYDDPSPELPYDRDGTGLVDGKPLMLPVGVQRVRMRSGHDVELAVPMYPGKWGRLIQRQYREEELLQFLGRLRPVYREGEAPVWFALSSVIPEEVVVDDLISLDDLISRNTFLWEGARRTDGVIQSDLLAVVCGELFADVSAVRKEMAAAGLDETALPTATRANRGFVPVKWSRRAGDAGGLAYVRADLADPIAALNRAFESHLGFVPAHAELAGPAITRTAARPRDLDKIEIELGDRQERKKAEADMTIRVAERVFASGDVVECRRDRSDGSRLLPARVLVSNPGEEGKASGRDTIAMYYADLEAQAATEEMWSRILTTQEEQITAPVIADNGPVYEQLADLAFDADDPVPY